jgi:hypothetical protein
MRTAHLLLLTVNSAMLMCGTGSAAPDAAAPSQKAAESSAIHAGTDSNERQNLHRVLGKKLAPGGPAAGRSGQGKRNNGVLDRQGSLIPRPATPPHDRMRHLSPNPAVVDGSARSSRRTAGSIDGRQVHRRP